MSKPVKITALIEQHILERFGDGSRFIRSDIEHISKKYGRGNGSIYTALNRLEQMEIIAVVDRQHQLHSKKPTKVYVLIDAEKIRTGASRIPRSPAQIKHDNEEHFETMNKIGNRIEQWLDNITRARLSHA